MDISLWLCSVFLARNVYSGLLAYKIVVYISVIITGKIIYIIIAYICISRKIITISLKIFIHGPIKHEWANKARKL